jgi:hypothetical protein
MNIKQLDNIPPWDWPEDAYQIIVKSLNNKSGPVSARLMAADLAGNSVVMDDEMADLLLAILLDSSESEELRAKAAISLGPALEYGNMMEFDDPDDIMLTEKKYYEVRNRLRSLYQDDSIPKELRRRILEASIRSPMNWHKQAVQNAYTSKEPNWVLTAVFCMGYIKGFDQQILESLESKDPEIIYWAVCAAGNWEVKAAWPYVEELINRKDIEKPLLLATIEAAAHIDPYEASALLSDLANSPDEEIAETVTESLAMAGLMLDDDFDEDDLDDDLDDDDLEDDFDDDDLEDDDYEEDDPDDDEPEDEKV